MLHKLLKNGLYILLMLIPCTASHAGKVTYVYTDPQGTPLAEADEQGNIVATYDYTPYGGQAMGVAVSGPGYTGHVADADTGLVYMQARYFDPSVGQFLSIDPRGVMVSDAFSFNRYAYANNNPLAYIDPDGRANKAVYLVELAASGMRKLARLSKERAVVARKQGLNVVTERRQLAHEIETAAYGKADQLKHAGHELEDGARGLPHYQTEGARGHSFWGAMSTVLVWTADGLDDVAEAASYLPDPTPRPATDEDMHEWEQTKAGVLRAWSYYTPPKSYFKRAPPPPPRPPTQPEMPPQPNSGSGS